MNVPTMIFREEFKLLDRKARCVFVDLCQYALLHKLDGLIPLSSRHVDLVIHQKIGGERNEITDSLPSLLAFQLEGEPLLSIISSCGYRFLKINHWNKLSWQSAAGAQ